MWIPNKDEDGNFTFAPTFEDTQGLTTVWKGYVYTAVAGEMNCFEQEITSQVKLRGGWYELFNEKAVDGDYIEFSVIDKNDVLGLFSTYGLTVGVDILELKKFVRTEYVNPNTAGSRQTFLSNGATTVVAGLFLRICYMSNGAEDVKIKIVEKYHEI